MSCGNENMTRGQLMQKINESSFAAYDMLLYLDTHPFDEKAMEYYRERLAERKEALAEYTENFGPLLADDAESCGDTWKWGQQPFPWEKEGACR